MKKFMIEFRLTPGSKNKVLDIFEVQGPNRTAGVTISNAWIGTRSDLIFVMCESAEESLVEQACQAWKQFGEVQIYPVIGVEQY